MRRERVADNIYVFISDAYVQVTCGVLIGRTEAIVIDTLPVPQETRAVRDFIAEKLGPNRVRYVINTHFHSDHVYGSYLFPSARVISHAGCREQLDTVGRASLQAAKRRSPILSEVELRLPSVTFQEEMRVHVYPWTLRLIHTPGHTSDSLVVSLPGEKLLFAADTVMPVPHIVWGDRKRMKSSLEVILALKPDVVVQGHGQVLLRGEMRQTIATNLVYLDALYAKVSEVVRAGGTREDLANFTIEKAGKSRLPLDGLVETLHQDNVDAMFNRLSSTDDR